MAKDLFIQVPLDEFTAIVKIIVKEAVKDAVEEQRNPRLRLVTTDELAEAIQTSKMSIHNWRNEGWLPYYKIGNSVRFNLEEVMKAIEKRNRQKRKGISKKNLAA